MMPQIATWRKTIIDGSLGATGTKAAVGLNKIGAAGLLYHGLATLGCGATLAGIILGTVTVFIIERQLAKAGWFAFARAALTFFGVIRGEEIGIAQSPIVVLGYPSASRPCRSVSTGTRMLNGASFFRKA
jgi:AGZA family xanthine/uracil permease-like MFS transporter